MRGESESERNPMLLFEFVRLLFKFKYQTPAFDESFQLPLDKGAMLRHLPLLPLQALEDDPAADHAAEFVYELAHRQKAMSGHFF